MCFAYIVQYREVNDKQFFIEVHRFPLVHRGDVNGDAVLDNGLRGRYGLAPVNLVVSGMRVLGYKREVVLVVLVEIPESNYHIEQGVVFLFLAPAFSLGLLAFQDVVVVRLRTR